MPAWMTSLLREDVSVPMPSAASRMMTARPACARARATARPTTPAPTTMQSMSSTLGSFCGVIVHGLGWAWGGVQTWRFDVGRCGGKMGDGPGRLTRGDKDWRSPVARDRLHVTFSETCDGFKRQAFAHQGA